MWNILDNLQIEKLKMAIALIKSGCDVNKSFEANGIIMKPSPLQLVLDMPLMRVEEPTGIEYAARLMVSLIDLVVNAGYTVNIDDLDAYSNSWLSEYLTKYDLNLMKHLDNVFLISLNVPMRLDFICRVKVRSVLNKPLLNSVNSLNIPKDLKSFLFFE